MLDLFRSIFNFADTWMIYRITVGIGTLLIGISCILAVSYLKEIIKLLKELRNKNEK